MIDLDKYMIADEGYLTDVLKYIGKALALIIGVPLVVSAAAVGIAIIKNKKDLQRVKNPCPEEQESLNNWPGWASAMNKEIDKLRPEIQKYLDTTGLSEIFEVKNEYFQKNFYHSNDKFFSTSSFVPLCMMKHDVIKQLTENSEGVRSSIKIAKFTKRFKDAKISEFFKSLESRISAYQYFELVISEDEATKVDSTYYSAPYISVGIRFTKMIDYKFISPGLPPYQK